ncbi:MAG TPA: ABC transporter ATP-binding protein [Tepidisphaeraceae bacterium]|nr:ABC transporter ATP-binding protein [Tepidisphaeraceae bacterium]
MRSAQKALEAGALGVAPAQVENDEEQKYRPIEWPLVQRMLSTLRPYRKQYMIGISIGLVHVLCDMLGPKFIQAIIDFCQKYASAAVQMSQNAAIRHLMGIIGLWCLVFACSVTLQRICIITMTRAGETVQFGLRQRLFDHLQTLSMSYYDKTKLGRIISRMTSDINSLREVNVWGIWQIIANGMIMLVAASMLVYTSPRLFLSVVWLGPLLYVANRTFIKKAGSLQQVAREGWTRVSTNLAENITGMRVVTAFHRQDPNLAVFNRLQVDNTMNNLAIARVNGVYQPMLQTTGFIGKAIILLYGGYLIASGQMADKGVGSIVAAYLYWDWFMQPILNLGNFYNQLMQAMAGAERVFNLLDMKPDVQDVPQAKPLARIIGDVKFEDVTFGYNPERPVLHSVSFNARPGQTFALVGATGSGKSSIISLIARFYQPHKGRVLVDGQDIRYVTGESLHKQMGLVLQVNYLFTGTVLENIRYATPTATLEHVISAAKAIGSHDAIMQLQNGYHTEVGERGANMSLGQRQLICFTRAFLADPRIFMLDEATSAVDTATELLVQESLEKLLAGRTTFIVAHRLSTIMRADCILVIEKGHIIERGTHDELVDLGGKYAHLYEQFVQHAA